MNSSSSPCPSCGGRRTAPITWITRVSLGRCELCGLTFSRRRPDDAELDAWYSEYPTIESISPITRSRFEDLIGSFEPYRELGTLIDIGAGSGHLLKAAAERGWIPHAFEYAQHLREGLRTRGVEVHQGEVTDSHLEAASFDVVAIDGVIEHMREPREALRAAARILRPGGLLYMTTPNFDALSRRVLRERWQVIEYPEHLNYFTATTLRRLAESLGFQEIESATTGISFGRALADMKAGAGENREDRGLRHGRAGARGNRTILRAREGQTARRPGAIRVAPRGHDQGAFRPRRSLMAAPGGPLDRGGSERRRAELVGFNEANRDAWVADRDGAFDVALCGSHPKWHPALLSVAALRRVAPSWLVRLDRRIGVSEFTVGYHVEAVRTTPA